MLITPTGRHGIFADRDNPELKSPRRARAALPILILYAQRNKTITFRELADAIAAPDRIDRTMIHILKCINKEMEMLSEHPSWEHEDIPTPTTIVVVEDGGPSGFMSDHMRRNEIEPTQENYERYFIRPVYEYEYWKEVIDAIIQSPHW